MVQRHAVDQRAVQIEQQRGTYGDQVYDVLGDSYINTSLQDLLIRAIREDGDPAHLAYMDEIIDGEIGVQLEDVLRERALVGALALLGARRAHRLGCGRLGALVRRMQRHRHVDELERLRRLGAGTGPAETRGDHRECDPHEARS